MSTDGSSSKWRIVAVAVFVGVVVLAAALYWRNTRLVQYEVIRSPDSRFRIVVYRKPVWPSAMPGQGSDAPGIVRLYDQSGRLLNEANIPMVQQMNDLVWTPDHVGVPLVFDWQLPK